MCHCQWHIYTVLHKDITDRDETETRKEILEREREPYVKGESGSRKGYFEDYRINLKI
jgi:hypothetical protein